MVILLLVAILLAGIPVSQALAYTGGYGLNFAGDDELMRADYYGIFGLDPACRDTASISLWVRPLGAPQTAFEPGALPVIFTNVPNWIGIARGAIPFFDGNHDAIWVWMSEQFGTRAIEVPYTVGEWVNIALVHGDGRLKAYKNGVLVGDIAAASMGGLTCGRIGVGAYYSGDQGTPPSPIVQEFTGQIDEVAIFRAALTESEIREYMYREIDAGHPKWGQIGAYYKMSNGSGTTVTDNGTGTYTGQIYGGVDWVTSAAHAGPRNTLAFDGVDEYINVPDHTNLDQTLTLSFEAWVNPINWNNNTATPFAVKGDNSGTPEVNYYFGKSATNQMMFSYYSGGSRVDVVDSSNATYSDNVWTHLAYAVDVANNRVRFYRDGMLLSEVSQNFALTPLSANDRALTLASFLSSGDAVFRGKMDEVRLWSSVRSLDEIRQNMDQTLKGDEAGLEAYYRFDMYNATTQTIAYEMTSDKINGTLQNMEANVDWVTSDAFNTWVGTDNGSWSGSGNWSRNAAPLASDNVGVYGYTGGNNPSFSTLETAGNMVVASTGSLTANTGGTLTVSGRLFNYGRLQQTQAVSGDGDIGFFNTGNYGGLLLDPNTDNMGNTTVIIRGNQDCTNAAGDTVKRCFDITPSTNNTGIGKTVTFFFDQSEESGKRLR